MVVLQSRQTVLLATVMAVLAAGISCGCSSESSGGEDESDTGFTSVDSGDPGFDAAFPDESDAADGAASPTGECQTNSDCAALFPDLGPCEVALCNISDGACKVDFKADLTPCSNGNACIADSLCEEGACVGGLNLVCNDDNPCTTDACDPAQGCLFTAKSGACDDGNPCTENDSCEDGLCAGASSTCPCISDNSCGEFDDDNPCNGELICGDANTCVVDPETIIVCDQPGTGCLVSQCNPAIGQCVLTPAENGTVCDDGDVCTLEDRCVAGACISESSVACPTDDVCQIGTCQPDIGCVFGDKTGPCDDGNPCTSDDACLNGVCVGGGNECDCEVDADCGDFDDGDLCNGVVGCIENKCETLPGSAVVCDVVKNGPCTVTECQPATGVCETVPTIDGTACSDGDRCTLDDQCVSGTCTGTVDRACGGGCLDSGDCDDLDPCTIDECAGGACVYEPIFGGDCACGSDIDCNDANGCTLDVCDVVTGECSFTPAAASCDDGNACTTGDACAAGACQPGSPVVCDDGDPCTNDSCNPASGCVSVDNGSCGGGCTSDAQCDDTNLCTVDVCSGGACVHNPVSCGGSTAGCELTWCKPNAGCQSAPASAATSGINVLYEQFADGDALGWKLTTNNEDVYWSVGTGQAASDTFSLYMGNPETGNFDFGPVNALAESPPILLPQGGAKLTFAWWAELGQQNCFNDVLYILVNNTPLDTQICSSSGGGFLGASFDLSEYSGQVVRIGLLFQAFNGELNDGEGMYIDNFGVQVTPPETCL